MKVVHILPNNSVGGAPINVGRIAKLTETHFQHEVLYMNFASDGLILLNKFVPINLSGSVVFNFIKIMIYLFRLRLRNGPFLICTHGRFCGLLFRFIFSRFPIPVVHTYRGFTLTRYSGFMSKFRNTLILFLEKTLSQSGTIIAVGAGEYEAICSALEPKKLELVYNPVMIKSAETSSSPKYDVIFIGRKSYQKGYDRFLSIAALDKNSKMAWFGDDEDFICSGPLPENVAVHSSTDNLVKTLSETKYLGVLSRWEGASTVVIEALMSGVPVIATPCQGVDEFIQFTGAGQTVPLDKFSSTIQELLLDSRGLKAFQAKSESIYDMVNLVDIKNKYIRIYKGAFKNV